MSLITLRGPNGEIEAVDKAQLKRPKGLSRKEPWVSAYKGWKVICDGHQMTTLQSEAWSRVKAVRNIRQQGSCRTPIGQVQCDERSRSMIAGFVAMSQLQGDEFSVRFTLADNTHQDLTAKEIGQVAVAVTSFIDRTHQHALMLREKIYAKKVTAKQLESLDLEHGWPT